MQSGYPNAKSAHTVLTVPAEIKNNEGDYPAKDGRLHCPINKFCVTGARVLK